MGARNGGRRKTKPHVCGAPSLVLFSVFAHSICPFSFITSLPSPVSRISAVPLKKTISVGCLIGDDLYVVSALKAIYPRRNGSRFISHHFGFPGHKLYLFYCNVEVT